MKCPKYNNRAISFVAWACGKLWIRYRCPHCGTTLKASRRTWLTILACVVLSPLLMFPLGAISSRYHIEDERAKDALTWCMILLYLAFVAFLDWRTGSYAIQGKSKDEISQSP